MSKSDTFENDLLKMIFQATAIANLCDNASSSPLASLFVALHTSDPGETGVQTTGEANYGAYARATIARTTVGWTIATNTVTPAATISFPASTSGTNTVTHFSVGAAVSGASKIFYSGTVTPNIVVTSGVTPQLTTASTITED